MHYRNIQFMLLVFDQIKSSIVHGHECDCFSFWNITQCRIESLCFLLFTLLFVVQRAQRISAAVAAFSLHPMYDIPCVTMVKPSEGAILFLPVYMRNTKL